MVDKEFIRKKHFLEGWSIRRIAKQLEMSRKTIRKMLQDSEIPTYRLKEARPRPVIGRYLETIRAWLVSDLTAPKKQRHTAKRIFDRLVAEHGYKGSSPTVRRTVRELRQEIRPVSDGFVPLTAEAGEQAQVDWGEAFVRIGGEERKVFLFCMRLRKSGVAFVSAFPVDRIEAFLAGHRQAFEFFGGVPKECVYDNLKSAVVAVLTGPHRKETSLFSGLRGHYLFDSRFCNVASGNEKGSVENLVGFVRRNALVPVPDFADLAGLNAHLLAWCEKERDRRQVQWEDERQGLSSLPALPLECAVGGTAVVTKTSLVKYGGNVYSVPTGHEGRVADVTATWDRIRISMQGKILAEHERLYGRGRSSLVLAHYLPLLEKKPRAARNAHVVRDLEDVWQQARKILDSEPEGYRELVAILALHREYDHETLTWALGTALEMRRPTAAIVRQLVIGETAPPLPPITVPPRFAELVVQAPDLDRYDRLVHGAA